ncbi:hypercellular protein [Mycolicibacterium fortuitum subsp. acetamidolyticum]|uniref:Hypercellular protein n=1 Tax=Mycolicibacterium fortuitum subsp. acetamidolyticum TaxID=144550 RepID=A0A117IGR7_MYCFO|nr:hypercellular protein [Mycolicibacterium fortuitum subsp. acetamidolyticum]
MVAAGPRWVGGGALRARRMHTWRCAGAAQRSQAERPAGGPAGGVSHSLALAHSPTPVRAALCGPFLPLRERGRTHPVNNSQGRPLSLRSKVCETYIGCAS